MNTKSHQKLERECERINEESRQTLLCKEKALAIFKAYCLLYMEFMKRNMKIPIKCL